MNCQNKMMERAEAKRKIGILGGTFNPIHNGHLQIAQQAKDYLALDEMFLMPSGNSYMKKSSEILSGELRSHLITLAIKEYAGLYLSKMEIERPGNTYTCDTLRLLHEKYPMTEFYFVMGEDSLLSMMKWKEPETIFRLCTVVVAVRGDKSKSVLQEQIINLKKRYSGKIVLLPGEWIPISSSDIRNGIQHGKDVADMMPPAVYDYIRKHHLYE